MQAEDAGRQLREIRHWMREGRRVMTESWRFQLWWGVLSSVALIATWWAVRAEAWTPLAWVWPVALVLGWLGSVVLARIAPARARNQATRAVEGVWVGAGATLTLVGLAGAVGGVLPPAAIPGTVAAVLGGAYWATARVAGIAWLRGLAGVWWAGAGLLLLVPFEHALLMLAAMALLFEAGPALILAREGGATP